MIDGERLPSREPPSALGERLCQAAGVLVLGSVLVGYFMSLRIGMWPPSHPWSGITLVGLALLNLGLPRSARGPQSAASRITTASLSTAAAFLWLGATVIRVSR
jgi:hypothetical protein